MRFTTLSRKHSTPTIKTEPAGFSLCESFGTGKTYKFGLGRLNRLFLSIPLDIRSSVNRSHIKAESGGVVFLAIDLTPALSTAISSNMNVCLAIDCSGSMGGDKINNAIESAVGLIRQLRPTDILSVVSFESNPKVEFPASRVTDPSRIEQIVRRLSPQSGTNMHGGLEYALEEVLKNARQPGTVSRIILLTDGQPTEGKTEDHEFVELVNKIRGTGITVTAFGLGDDYNENLLTKIAQAGGGLWYHVRNPAVDIPNNFKGEMAQMSKTVLSRPELTIQLIPGAEIIQTYAVRPMLTQLPNPTGGGKEYRFPIRDLIGGEEQNLVFRLKVPPRKPGQFRLVRTQLGDTVRENLITYTDDPILFEAESNPYPRLLLSSAEGTVLMQKGLATGDQTAIARAETMLKIVSSDPSVETVVRSSPVMEQVMTTLQDTHTTLMKGPLTEDEKKQALQQATVIGKRVP